MSSLTRTILAAVVLALGLANPFPCARAQSWRLDGNAGTDPTTDFLGTRDEEPLVIRTGDEERMRVTNGGRVGIGTSGPDAKLHVRAGDGTDAFLVGHAGKNLPDLLIDADSNVGINTGDPAARFVIRNDSFGQRPLMSVLAGDQRPFHMSSTGSVTIDPVGADFALRIRTSSSPNPNSAPVPFFVTATDDSSAIYVTRDGDVGIGTSGEGINDQLRVRGNENSGSSASLRIVSGADQQTMLLDGNEIDGVNAGLFLNNNANGDVVLATGGGNVGIGVAGPNHKLAVRDDNHQIAIIDSDNTKTWTLTSHQATRGVGLWEDGTQGRFVVTAGGRVGIGTTDPNHELVVQGDDPALQIRDDTTNNSANAARFELLERGGGNFDGGAFFWWNGETNKLLIGTKVAGNNTNLLVLDRATNSVGIGTQNPGNFRLAVNGRVRAKEIVVETGWSDFVFAPDYNLPSLEEVQAHIGKHRHLPDIPSAAEVSRNGVNVGDMQSRLLRKVEELTLYLIDMHQRIGALEQENARLRGGQRVAEQAGATL